ncbi:MAG: DUF2851 family protein [Dehalococcoidia bacterium]|nr:DUF2851 family protein [Dehalococcoidia bacterium]
MTVPLHRLAEDAGVYAAHEDGRDREARADAAPFVEVPFSEAPFPEATLTALWLLGRVPAQVLAAALPHPLLRAGRAGRGPGPDVREAAFLAASGATLAGDVEVHLRASDFVRHGHADDPAYAGVVLHLCWVDDRAEAGTPTALPGRDGRPGGGEAPTVALGAWLSAREVERLVALGPDLEVIAPPCSGAPDAVARVRDEGRQRLAERTWRAWRLADRYGFDGALAMLLERAVASTAGRIRESEERRAALVAVILDGLGSDPVEVLARHALDGRAALVAAVRAASLGDARAAEVAWNAALPLVAALAAAYDDVPLARATAALAEGWPAPRPYGRTRALASALSSPPAPAPAPLRGEGGGEGPLAPQTRAQTSKRAAGALYAQGLLHLQDLWCTRGGCGACPLSADLR